MLNETESIEIVDIPAYIRSWSVVCIPKFVQSVLDIWQSNFGQLPPDFTLVACPQMEIKALGGLPSRVRELTNAKVRVQQFTSCNKLYMVILLLGDDADKKREEIQQYLPWSEAYEVNHKKDSIKLNFVDAVEDLHEE